MTKKQELEILAKIQALIESAGADSYIGMTFAGIVDVCRDNIENDFGACPVEDLKEVMKTVAELNAKAPRLEAEIDAWEEAYSNAYDALGEALYYVQEAANHAKQELNKLSQEDSAERIAGYFRAMKKAEALAYNMQICLEDEPGFIPGYAK